MPKKEIRFKAGDVLFKKGDICDGVFTVVNGTAEQFYDIRGKIRPFREEKKGAVLGKKGALEGIYDVSVRAKTDLVVERMSREEYIAELQREGELSPTPKETSVTADDASDAGDFDFDFGFGGEEEKKPARPERPSRTRRTSTALQKTDVSETDEIDFAGGGRDTSAKKNELVKVGRQLPSSAFASVDVKPVILPADDKKSALKEWLAEGQEPQVSFGTCFLLASIDGDDGTYRDAIYRVLRQIPDVQVKVVDKFVTEQNPWRAVLQMRAWMKRYDADAGLYARPDAAGRVLEFHTVRIAANAEQQEQGTGSRFFLPVEMNEAQRAFLQTVAVCALVPTRLEHEQLQRIFLPVALSSARAAGATPMVGLTPEEQAVDLCCYADALSLAAFYTPHGALGDEATAVYEQARSLMPPYAPEYVFINRQLGLIHQIAGEKKEDVALLKKAEQTFEAAVKTLSPKRQPADWGDLKTRIGGVRQRIALNTGDGEDFSASIDAYREALGVLKPQHDTEKWADALNGLARTIQLFGTFGTKTVLLERAMKIYEKELALLDKEKFPLQWARASNNMASVLFMLFNHKNDMTLLKRAVDVFSDALAVYDRLGVPKMASVAQENLKRAEKILSQTERELEAKKNWLDDLLDDDAEQASKNEISDTVADEATPDRLHFEKITLPDDLSDDE